MDELQTAGWHSCQHLLCSIFQIENVVDVAEKIKGIGNAQFKAQNYEIAKKKYKKALRYSVNILISSYSVSFNNRKYQWKNVYNVHMYWSTFEAKSGK